MQPCGFSPAMLADLEQASVFLFGAGFVAGVLFAVAMAGVWVVSSSQWGAK